MKALRELTVLHPAVKNIILGLEWRITWRESDRGRKISWELL